MRTTARPFAPLLIVAALFVALPALAQDREFTGRIERVGKDSIVVDRNGDKIRFERGRGTTVDGKPDWRALESDDRVTVKWKMGESPRRAHEVKVLRSKKGGGKRDR